ncbi:MAG: molybdopterin-dependent oxidoreductase [Nitrospiraceae bacterium]|nr:molybdopterin-dependent oxidoreductase [Nitrospiraceae bacterium]
MQKKISLTINGRTVSVAEGVNLIEAAEAGGVHIPNLCHLKGMKGIGACRLCMVEVEGLKAPVTACTTKAKESMSVKTDTPKIRELRSFVIDLILSMHPLDCMTCTKAGVCRLQEYAYDLGIKESTFSRKTPALVSEDDNPLIKREPDYCVLCGRCVRACRQQGTNVLDFMGRGVGSKVTTAADLALHDAGCTFCGSCIDACPVNAIVEADRWRKGREWDYSSTKTACLLCGCSCSIEISTRDGSIQKAANADATGYICAVGRFGHEYFSSPERITSPMKRTESGFQQISWQEALDAVSESISRTGKKTGLIVDSSILNEDALALKRLAADVAGIKNIDATSSLYGFIDEASSEPGDLGSADLIVLAGIVPDQKTGLFPLVDVEIRRRIADSAKLVVIAESAGASLASAADMAVSGDEASFLKSVTKTLSIKTGCRIRSINTALMDAEESEEADAVAEMIMQAVNPVVLSAPQLYGAASNIALFRGQVYSLPLQANANGVHMMGLRPEGMSYSDMLSGGVKVLYAVGAHNADARPGVDFIVAQHTHISGLAKYADILLPAAAFTECDGTIVDYMLRTKKVSRVCEPPGSAKSHREIFRMISKEMGTDIKAVRDHEVRSRIKTRAGRTLRPFVKDHAQAVSTPFAGIDRHVVENSRLRWIKVKSERKKSAAMQPA